jgi:ubiquinone/menaquinone biosynthesis C-methylase UbiE
MDPSTHATNQYETSTSNLSTRISFYKYSTNPQPWFSWLAERLPSTGSVLEVGAGTGALWEQIGDTALKLTLTDFSSAMCEQLRSIPVAKVVKCDAQNLPFKDGEFDVVIASHMLYHLDDPQKALNEFARVLNPGGSVLISLGGKTSNKELNALGRAIGRPSVMVGTTRIVAQTTPQYLAISGFEDIREEMYHGDLEVPTAEPVLAYLASIGEGLSESQEKMARKLIEDKIVEDGCFRVTKEVVLFTARKK